MGTVGVFTLKATRRNVFSMSVDIRQRCSKVEFIIMQSVMLVTVKQLDGMTFSHLITVRCICICQHVP